jgi:hypothetical protein
MVLKPPPGQRSASNPCGIRLQPDLAASHRVSEAQTASALAYPTRRRVTLRVNGLRPEVAHASRERPHCAERTNF